MPVQGVKFTQAVTELQSINAAHNLAPVDLLKTLKDVNAVIAQGVLMKRAVSAVGMNSALIAGGVAGAHAVIGIRTSDRLVKVYHLSTAAAIATMADITSEFAISADDTLDNPGGTDTTADQLLVFYERAAGEGDFEPWIQDTDHVSEIAGVLSHYQSVDPIADQSGRVVDVYTVQFGAPGAFTVSVDWSDANTTLQEIYQDLVAMRLTLERAGWNGTAVLLGTTIMSALLGKIETIPNDQRTIARQQDDGAIRFAEFVLKRFTGQYFHPGGPGGANPAPGYVDAVGPDEVLMYDPAAPWTFLRVRLDNFKLPQDPGPLGIITALSKDGKTIDLFAESKPFPIPVPEATIRTDATAP